jgi:hypothetical protein
MKNIYRGLIFLALNTIVAFSYAQEFKIGSWQNDLFGIWKLDSTKMDNKKLRFWDGKDDGEHAHYYSFKEDHSFIMYTDPDMFIRDTFDLVDSRGKKLVYTNISNFEICSVDKNNMVMLISYPEINKSRRQTRKSYFSRSYVSIELPSVTGTWGGSNTKSFSLFTDKNPNFLDLKKDGTISVIINSKKDSGTWKINEANYAIEMELTSGRYLSYIITKEARMLEITNPFNPQQLLDFIREESQMMNPNFKEQLVTTTPNTLVKPDTIPPLSFFKMWKVVKMLQGSDSVACEKTISVLFLKNMQFAFTIDNKKTTGIWKINTSTGQIIFSSKDNDILCNYKFINVATDAYGNNDVHKPELILTTILPGEKRIGTYIFHDSN